MSNEFDSAVLKCFLKKQLQLFPEKVAEDENEAEEFLLDCMAVVVESVDEVWEYFEEEGLERECINIQGHWKDHLRLSLLSQR